MSRSQVPGHSAGAEKAEREAVEQAPSAAPPCPTEAGDLARELSAAFGAMVARRNP
jgi:hypothetical protein